MHKGKAGKNFGIMCAGTRSPVKPSAASCQLMALGMFLHPFFFGKAICMIRRTEVQHVLVSFGYLMSTVVTLLLEGMCL